MPATTLPHVVIVGAGFGGLEAARRLAHAPVRLTLIDRRNYHLFQPLLYQVAIAGLVPSQIAYPVRTIFRHQKNLAFQMGEVTAVDFDHSYVKLDGSVVAYDYLILSVGGRTNFLHLQSVEENACQIKDIDSAIAARNHMLTLFERASHEADADVRRAMLTFVVVGAGPTGVETAGALAELIRHVIAKDYPNMDLDEVRVLLLEASAVVMSTYPDGLRRATYKLLTRKHVEIMLKARVTGYDGLRVTLDGAPPIPTRTLIWTAGVRAAELADGLGIAQAASGRLVTQDTLQLKDHPEVFVIGDAAYFVDSAGQPLPMLATVAQQQAKAAAAGLRRLLKGEQPKAFQYRDPGLLATIGRNAAVARIWGLSFSGYPAWFIWVLLHIYRLIGFRSRLLVLINWAWDYLFYESQVRLITRE